MRTLLVVLCSCLAARADFVTLTLSGQPNASTWTNRLTISSNQFVKFVSSYDGYGDAYVDVVKDAAKIRIYPVSPKLFVRRDGKFQVLP